MSQLIVIEEYQRRHKGRGEWVPMLDTFYSSVEARQALRRTGTKRRRLVTYSRGGVVPIIECEECGECALSSDLPEGWAQFGKSKLAHAVSGLASHCPQHS